MNDLWKNNITQVSWFSDVWNALIYHPQVTRVLYQTPNNKQRTTPFHPRPTFNGSILGFMIHALERARSKKWPRPAAPLWRHPKPTHEETKQKTPRGSRWSQMFHRFWFERDRNILYRLSYVGDDNLQQYISVYFFCKCTFLETSVPAVSFRIGAVVTCELLFQYCGMVGYWLWRRRPPRWWWWNS